MLLDRNQTPPILPTNFPNDSSPCRSSPRNFERRIGETTRQTINHRPTRSLDYLLVLPRCHVVVEIRPSFTTWGVYGRIRVPTAETHRFPSLPPPPCWWFFEFKPRRQLCQTPGGTTGNDSDLLYFYPYLRQPERFKAAEITPPHVLPTLQLILP